jgi:hypothetical protein
MLRPLLACIFAPGLAAVSGYFRRVSGMAGPDRVNPSEGMIRSVSST